MAKDKAVAAAKELTHGSEAADGADADVLPVDVCLSRYYRRILDERSRERGVSRSEAVRQLINEAKARTPSATQELQLGLREIRTATAALRRLVDRGGAVEGFLTKIEGGADRIGRVIGG